MNIDLLLTGLGESGLLCDGLFDNVIGGVILDAETCELTLEFKEEDETLHLNIPVEEEYKEMLLFSHKIHIGCMDNGLIGDSSEVPLLYLNDPYGSEFGQGSPISKTTKSLLNFEQFMKRCKFGQPIHRENLGDEDSSGCVLRGLDPAALEYVPQLVRQRMLEVGPKMAAQATPVNVPSAPTLGPGGPGGARSRPPPTRRIPIKRPKQQRDTDED